MAIATRMRNPTSMSQVNGYEGFSWTCFFFGPFPALIRGDLFGFLAMFTTAMLTFGASGIIWMFVYNRWHFNRLLARGYQPAEFFHPQSSNVNISIENTISSSIGEWPMSEARLPVQIKPSRLPEISQGQVRIVAENRGFGKRGFQG